MKKRKGEKQIFKLILIVVIISITICYVLQACLEHEKDVRCVSLLGWFTREDRVKNNGLNFDDLQPGDILITLSTHSVGWRHGHAGLVIDKNYVLECVSLGKNSTLVDAKHWMIYSDYSLLRVKDATEEERKAVVAYALENLYDIPYHLSSGFLGKKAPKPDAPQFGLHCSYLVWYAWNYVGYDLDSNGGRLVTCYDLLQSEKVKIIQNYKIEPCGIK